MALSRPRRRARRVVNADSRKPCPPPPPPPRCHASAASRRQQAATTRANPSRRKLLRRGELCSAATAPRRQPLARPFACSAFCIAGRGVSGAHAWAVLRTRRVASLVVSASPGVAALGAKLSTGEMTRFATAPWEIRGTSRLGSGARSFAFASHRPINEPLKLCRSCVRSNA